MLFLGQTLQPLGHDPMRTLGDIGHGVAEDGRIGGTHPSVSHLTDASDLLRGVASGLAELRTTTTPAV